MGTVPDFADLRQRQRMIILQCNKARMPFFGVSGFCWDVCVVLHAPFEVVFFSAAALMRCSLRASSQGSLISLARVSHGTAHASRVFFFGNPGAHHPRRLRGLLHVPVPGAVGRGARLQPRRTNEQLLCPAGRSGVRQDLGRARGGGCAGVASTAQGRC